MEDDEIFVKVAKLLKNNNINYWICHGTLLGVIRDNMLLPWDHDIDFAVWADEVSKDQILKIFINSGFKQEIIMDEFDNLFFSTKGKRVDINFYRRNKDIAYTKWVSPSKNSFFIKLYYFIVCEWCYSLDINRIKVDKGWNRLPKWIFIQLLLLIKPLIPNSVKKILKQDVIRRLEYIGYSYSMNLMTFKKVSFLGVKVPVPIDSERYLELTYGKDWKIPNKNYVWFHEAKNLLSQKH